MSIFRYYLIKWIVNSQILQNFLLKGNFTFVISKYLQMKTINNYSKFIPYLYFLAVIIYWFTDVNKSQGITAYPILLFGVPFLYQIIFPNEKLNFSLGIIFVCLSSYMILAYLSDLLHIVNLSYETKRYLIMGGFFVIGNFIMALWMIRNSIKKLF